MNKYYIPEAIIQKHVTKYHSYVYHDTTIMVIVCSYGNQRFKSQILIYFCLSTIKVQYIYGSNELISCTRYIYLCSIQEILIPAYHGSPKYRILQKCLWLCPRQWLISMVTNFPLIIPLKLWSLCLVKFTT